MFTDINAEVLWKPGIHVWAHALGYTLLCHKIRGPFAESVPAACQLQEGPLLLAGENLGPTAFLRKVI